MSRRHTRRGFTLLEALIALGILVVTMTILVETQSTAALMTREAERRVVATDLAKMKMTEAVLLLEEEGFTDSVVREEGDFDDLGDEVLDVEFGPELEDYHWEYEIVEVDLGMIGNIMSLVGGGDNEAITGDEDGGGLMGDLGVSAPAGGGAPVDALSMLGFGPEMMSEYLSSYLRMIHVRVWWGESSKEAEERGDEIILVTHMANPTGVIAQPPLPGGE